jgi:hypothetical protein
VGTCWQNRPVQVLILVSLLILGASEFAAAACYNFQQALPAKAITQFRSGPAELLSEHPRGAARMIISMVRDLVASDQAVLPLVVDLSAKGNADQIDAIGTGLGQAALICSRVDQMYANEIQQMVAAANNRRLTIALTEVLGDQQLAAADSGGGGGGGGRGGGQTVTLYCNGG